MLTKGSKVMVIQGSISLSVLLPICALCPTFERLLRGAKVGRRAQIGRKQFMKLTPRRVLQQSWLILLAQSLFVPLCLCWAHYVRHYHVT